MSAFSSDPARPTAELSRADPAVDRKSIGAAVGEFYFRLRNNERLGPIFARGHQRLGAAS
ncbi:hypothetical protein [Mesorhizobium sp. INR15]|uniref:hypothetical protein n=1 Tax=Mesorhizobium sp. INR15 TaxID=2654248 RepID=UPI00215628C3|nr:hypothetical protein [Mesorhizobium sp. INR15]